MKPRMIAVGAAALLLAAGCGSGDSAEHSELDQFPLRGQVVSELDLPRPTFETWSVQDAPSEPVHDDVAPFAAIPQSAGVALTAAPTAGSQQECNPRGITADNLWSSQHAKGPWSGSRGVDRSTGRTFSVDVSQPAISVEAASQFASRCNAFTYNYGDKTVKVTATHNKAEVLTYQLDSLNLFTVTAETNGVQDSTWSTLVALGQKGDRVLAAQFTTPGRIDGPTVNIAGLWWRATAKKMVDGAPAQGT